MGSWNLCEVHEAGMSGMTHAIFVCGGRARGGKATVDTMFAETPADGDVKASGSRLKSHGRNQKSGSGVQSKEEAI